jgi:hypothetical protein
MAGLVMTDVLDDIGELVELLRLRAAITKGSTYGEVPLSNIVRRPLWLVAWMPACA